jgi:hypothetical protein
MLLVLMVILTVGLLFGIAYTASGKNLSGILAPQVKAQVAITPLSKLEQDQYVIVGLTNGTPDPTKNEVAAHVIRATSPSKQGSASATGSIPATKASGTLLFQNTGSTGIQLQGGTLTDANGVGINFGPVFVPVTGSGTATTEGVAAQAGSSGNIRAFDFDGTCCGYDTIVVKNQNAFTGGQDAVTDSVITPNDINNAINQVAPDLTNEAQSNLQTQIKPTERADTDSLSCKTGDTTDHNAGDQAKSVTATVSVTCTEVVYDYQAAAQIATQNLRSKAAKDQALQNFQLDGQIVVSPLSQQVVGANQEVAIDMQAQGLWVYQLTATQEQNLKHAVLNKSKQAALTLLQSSPGVATAQITLSTGTTMPSSESAITLTIQTLPGVQATTTPGNTSVPPASTMNPATSPGSSTPTPGFTPGGS